MGEPRKWKSEIERLNKRITLENWIENQFVSSMRLLLLTFLIFSRIVLEHICYRPRALLTIDTIKRSNSL